MKNKYIISCGGWQLIESGKDSDEAATKALEKMSKIEGENLRVSPVIETICLSDIEEDFDLEQYRDFCFCPNIMANAGLHNHAKNFNELIDQTKPIE